MEYVYMLSYVYIADEPDKDEEILIGLYSTEEKAQEAFDKYKKLVRFKDHVDCLIIDRCKINKDQWTDGYFTHGDFDLPVWIKKL